MKLSAKTRYGIAALTYMHLNDQELISLVSIAKHLNISKIYLEQVFTSLKQAYLVDAIKGPNGGYYLKAKDCNMYSIISALEPSLFEKTPESTEDSLINAALCDNLYTPLDRLIRKNLESIKLAEIAESVKASDPNSMMYYI